jgi:hypothetical protein
MYLTILKKKFSLKTGPAAYIDLIHGIILSISK